MNLIAKTRAISFAPFLQKLQIHNIISEKTCLCVITDILSLNKIKKNVLSLNKENDVIRNYSYEFRIQRQTGISGSDDLLLTNIAKVRISDAKWTFLGGGVGYNIMFYHFIHHILYKDIVLLTCFKNYDSFLKCFILNFKINEIKNTE